MLVPTQNVLGSSRADGGRVNTAADRFRLDQGKRALQKLLAEKRKAKAKRLKLSDYVRLYCTIFGGLLIIVGFSVLIFLVPMKIDPALATLSYEFNPTPVILTVERVDFIKGISKIDWCSCTEACTRDVFECYHIIVSYNSLPGGRYVTSGLLEAQQMLVELDATEATDGTNTGSPASEIKSSASERGALESSVSEHEALESSVSEHEALESSVSEHEALESSVSEREALESSASEHEALESSVNEGERNNPRRSENVSDDSLWSRTNHRISLLEINNSTSPDRRKRRLKRNTSVGQGCRYCLNCEVCSAKLLVNVKGCGYPPEVNCTEFLEKYGKPGRRLPGYYSSLDSSIALAEYDESLIRRELGEALGYTFGMMVLGVCIIVMLHLPYKKLLAKIPGRKIRTSE
ncbi:hypothetical protein HAZT_HAZT011940 [Hyalella azteca]|nr:hypothetical protein HAZT_HAZT011940 [Hyalella azteca]